MKNQNNKNNILSGLPILLITFLVSNSSWAQLAKTGEKGGMLENQVYPINELPIETKPMPIHLDLETQESPEQVNIIAQEFDFGLFMNTIADTTKRQINLSNPKKAINSIETIANEGINNILPYALNDDFSKQGVEHALSTIKILKELTRSPKNTLAMLSMLKSGASLLGISQKIVDVLDAFLKLADKNIDEISIIAPEFQGVLIATENALTQLKAKKTFDISAIQQVSSNIIKQAPALLSAITNMLTKNSPQEIFDLLKKIKELSPDDLSQLSKFKNAAQLLGGFNIGY